MGVSKVWKVVLGIATAWPPTYLVIFMINMFSMMVGMMADSAPGAPTGPPPELVAFQVLMAVHMFTMLWIFALLVIYVLNVFRNDRVSKDKKALWAVVLVLGNMIAMPIYWYLYIWKDPPKPQPSSE